jgi:predicted transcriptional regulator
MNPKITPEMADALHANNGDVRVTDPDTQRVYVLVDDDTHRKAMEALRQREDLEAIQDGVDDMNAGRMVPAEEAHKRVREHLLSKYGE